MERETTLDLLLTCHNLFLPQTFTYDIFDTKNILEHLLQFFSFIVYVCACPLRCNAKSAVTFIFNCIILLDKTEGKSFQVDKHILFILRHLWIKSFQTCWIRSWDGILVYNVCRNLESCERPEYNRHISTLPVFPLNIN